MSKFIFKPYSLELKEPFGTAHGTRTHTDGMLVSLEHEGITGYGECFMPPYYAENRESMSAFFRRVDVNKLLEINDLNEALDYVSEIDDENAGAKAAVDIALHDLFGKRLGVSVREIYRSQGTMERLDQWTIDKAGQWTIDNGQLTIRDSQGPSDPAKITEPEQPAPKSQHSALSTQHSSESQYSELSTQYSSTQYSALSTQYLRPTSYTIGIDTIETMVRKAKAASEFKILKIKLDGVNDIEVISAISEITDQDLFVDANQAWKDVDDAIKTADQLIELGVGLIEQPFAKGEWQKAGALKKHCAVPVVADEDVQRRTDISELAKYYDGINIKLMKCSGIREGFQMIEEARKHGLKVLLGCMTESSIGISAAAQFAEFADWCDLDGNLLIKNDTCEGVKTIDGLLTNSDAPGIGITNDSRLKEILKQDG